MKTASIALMCAGLALALPAIAQSGARPPMPANPWVGLWQAPLEGQPGVILTLGDDTGQLAGGIVFNVITRDGGQARILGHDAHALMNPRVEGNTLRFQVIRLGDRRTLDMTARMTADGKATFHCQNCGDAPEVEITRER